MILFHVDACFKSCNFKFIKQIHSEPLHLGSPNFAGSVSKAWTRVRAQKEDLFYSNAGFSFACYSSLSNALQYSCLRLLLHEAWMMIRTEGKNLMTFTINLFYKYVYTNRPFLWNSFVFMTVSNVLHANIIKQTSPSY